MKLNFLRFFFLIYFSLFHHIAVAELKADHKGGMYSSLTKPPETIIVGITIDWPNYKDGDGVLSKKDCEQKKYKILRKETVPFDDYIKRVLFWEWGPVRKWNYESLKAAAMAVKTFAWYKRFLGKRHKQGIDVLDNTCDQFFVSTTVLEKTILEYKKIDDTTFQNMKNAVTSTRKYILKRKTNRHEHVFDVEFRDTKATCDKNSTEGRCLPQNKADDWAKQGKTWREILSCYYRYIDIHQWKKLEVGDKVKSISDLIVRKTAVFDDAKDTIFTPKDDKIEQLADKTGIVEEIKYEKYNGEYYYDWINIAWDDGKKGWSADGHLKPIISGTTTDTDNGNSDSSGQQNFCTVQKGAIVTHNGYNIRDNPNTKDSTIINQNWTIQEGVILDGGEKANDHTWWLILWDNRKKGWSVEDGFVLTERKSELKVACLLFLAKFAILPIYSNAIPLLELCSSGLGVSYLYDEQDKQTRSSHRSNYNNPAHAPITRTQYVKLVSEALEVNNPDKPFRTPTEKPFNDVPVDDQFAPYIQYAKNKGIIQGCGSGNFCPDEYITKAEGIKIVIAGFKDKFADVFNAFSNGKEPVSLFDDVTDKSAWFYPYVYTAKEFHLLHGEKDSSFKPNELMSRANMAKVVCMAAFGPMECSNMGEITGRPFIFAVTPEIATLNESTVFTIAGENLNDSITFELSDCANITPIAGGTAKERLFQCTPSNTGGAKTGTLRYDSSSTNFSVEVKEPVSEPPVDEPPVDDPPVDEPPVDDPPVDDPPVDDPPEGDGLDHDDYSPGDATEFFILNGTMTTTCTFSDVEQSDWYAEAVNAFCSAGILVGYWENDQRVFVKAADKHKGLTTVVETLKVLIFASNYKYVGEHSAGSKPWHQFYLDEATKKGLNINGLEINEQITRQQALTWLAQLFYDYTGDEPVGFLKDKDITSGNDPEDKLSRYELAVLGYRAAKDTESDIHYGLFDAPAPKLPPSQDTIGQEVTNTALAAVGEKYPYVNSQYTFCARFVRTLFEKRAVWPDAKSMCSHYDKGLIQTTQNPPAGAAICYLPGDSNWNYGHVAIAIGDGTEVGATSLTQGITQRDIYLGTGYQGWISAEDFDNNYPQ